MFTRVALGAATLAISATSAFADVNVYSYRQPELLAPLTFISVFGYRAQVAFFADANIELHDAKIVQVDQVLKYVKPIKAGDKLYADVHVHSVRKSFGTDIIVTRNIVTDQFGDIVQETYTTLVGQSEEEGVEGFSDATSGV